MGLSLPGLAGALVALVIGLINYAVIVGVVERKLRELDRSQGDAERAEFERKVVLMKRIILVTDIVFFPVIGFFIGQAVGGYF